jgi:hypothetical protein
MEKVFVAKRVAEKLWSTEAAVDGALKEAAEFMSVMLTARTDVNAPITIGDGAQAKLMEAMKSLSDARSALIAAHDELRVVKGRLGIRTRLGGIETTPIGGLAAADEDEVRMQDTL